MIDIPEERILKEITNILMNDLPKVLLELEEQSEDSIRLPPFRYVGTREKLSVGIRTPYALLKIDEGIYATKDRIIKNVVYTIQITLKLVDTSSFWCYNAAIKTVIVQNSKTNGRITMEIRSKAGMISLLVKK